MFADLGGSNNGFRRGLRFLLLRGERLVGFHEIGGIGLDLD